MGWKKYISILKNLINYNFEIIEADEEAWNEDNLNSYCSNDDADFDSSYKRQAVEY